MADPSLSQARFLGLDETIPIWKGLFFRIGEADGACRSITITDQSSPVLNFSQDTGTYTNIYFSYLDDIEQFNFLGAF